MMGPPRPMLHGPLVLVEFALYVLPDFAPARTAASPPGFSAVGLQRDGTRAASGKKGRS